LLIILIKLLFKLEERSLNTSSLILSCFSLKILFIVSSSLQDTFGIIGVFKNSPIKASTCFLIKGMNLIEVGYPIP
jgi:hypothetical protein